MFRKKETNEFLQLLMQSAENALQGAKLFREAMFADGQPATYLPALKSLEEKGDSITHQIFTGLSKVFITPIDREDIMELASHIDDVMDGIEATIARFDYLNIEVSDKYMQDFADVLVESCDHILSAMQLLADKKFMEITGHTQQINRLENEGDRLMRESIRSVFTNPREPYHDFKLKELYQRLEETTDSCEDVADILDSMVLRYG